MTKVVLTVTNDLSFDQRMYRICESLSRAGFAVTLIGRKTRNSPELQPANYAQIRLPMIFSKGKLFYTEFSIRLFFKLLFTKADVMCAIDLDTILPVYFTSKLKGAKRVYDAHELFCEMKEVVSRPGIYRFWKQIERFAVPRFKSGYTVNTPIRDEFNKMYGVDYNVIRNVPRSYPLIIPRNKNPYFIYQGAVNEGRCFETLIPAMKQVNAPLVICGDGNFMQQALELVKLHRLEDKVKFRGKLLPSELREVSINAWAGITLFDRESKSNYYSLANRFFDYIAAGIPQLCVNYPVYAEINKENEVALLIDKTDPDSIAKHLNQLLDDRILYQKLQQNCSVAREKFTWEAEEKILINFYKDLIS